MKGQWSSCQRIKCKVCCFLIFQSAVKLVKFSVLLAGCLHQSGFFLSEGVQGVISPCQSQWPDPGYDQPDCPLSDRVAGGEPAQRHKQNVRSARGEAAGFKCIQKKSSLFKAAVCFIEWPEFDSVNGGILTLIISSLVFRVAVRDSILAAWPSLRPSSSDSKDCSSAKEIWISRK